MVNWNKKGLKKINHWIPLPHFVFASEPRELSSEFFALTHVSFCQSSVGTLSKSNSCVLKLFVPSYISPILVLYVNKGAVCSSFHLFLHCASCAQVWFHHYHSLTESHYINPYVYRRWDEKKKNTTKQTLLMSWSVTPNEVRIPFQHFTSKIKIKNQNQTGSLFGQGTQSWNQLLVLSG